MVENALELDRLRSNFYRNNYPRILIALLIMVVVNVALVGVVFYKVVNVPTPKYFAATVDGRTMSLYPLTQPLIPPTELLRWANRVAVAAFTYNFVNHEKALRQLRSDFTPSGWRFFESALKTAKTLKTVIDKKLVVSAAVTDTPVILDQSIIRGRYSWKIQMPMLVTYQSPSDQAQQAIVVTMVIARVPTAVTSRGIAIESFVTSVTRAPERAVI